MKGGSMAAPKGHAPYPGCEKGGKPKLHTDEFIENQADALSKWSRYPNSIFLSDFCTEQELDPDLMSIWAKKNIKFAGAYKLAKFRQESRLIKAALYKQNSDSFTKFLLVNNHGYQKYSEKTEQTITAEVTNINSYIVQQVGNTSRDLVNADNDGD